MSTPPIPNKPKAIVEVSAKDVHSTGSVFCPNPKMPLWSNHPRVFKAGEKIAGGH
jgi:uncharacterized Zn-finger protein